MTTEMSAEGCSITACGTLKATQREIPRSGAIWKVPVWARQGGGTGGPCVKIAVWERLRALQLPLWKRWKTGGMPLLPNAQSAPFAPLSLLGVTSFPVLTIGIAGAGHHLSSRIQASSDFDGDRRCAFVEGFAIRRRDLQGHQVPAPPNGSRRDRPGKS